MAFTAKIVFTGLCGLVPKQNPPMEPKAFCVVLPNAWKKEADLASTKVSSVDEISLLRRHAPFVYFSNDERDADNRQNLEGLWFLKRHRLVVQPKFADGHTCPAAWGEIGGLASFEDVASAENHDLLCVENAVLAPHQGNKVAAQVVLHHGTLSSEPLGVEWVFDSFLRPAENPVVKGLNYRFTVTLENLTELTVVQQSLRGRATGKKFTFSKGPAFITVANLCDNNPLQWGLEPLPESLPDDDDFRWYYELVDHPGKLSAALGHLRCPIPRPARVPRQGISKTGPIFGGNGLNCLDFRFPAVDFEF